MIAIRERDDRHTERIKTKRELGWKRQSKEEVDSEIEMMETELH